MRISCSRHRENAVLVVLRELVHTFPKRLNPKTFFKVKIVCPTLEEQQKIAAVLSAADKEIETLKKQLDQLKQEKKALMQQLLTGKRRVKIDDKEIA